MDNDVPGVDQNPVAVRKSLYPGPAIAVFLEASQKVVGDGPDMAMGTAGGHNQAVRHGALALEVNEDNVLRLVVIQTVQDQLLQLGHTLREDSPGRLGGGGLRSLRTVGAQRSNSCFVTAAATSSTDVSHGQPSRIDSAAAFSRKAVEDWKWSGP